MRMTRLVLLLVSLFPCVPAPAGAGELEKVLRSLPSDLRSGYSSTLGGGTIFYHSVNAHARNALLARTTDGTQFVEWKSESLPSRTKEKGTTFAWLAALSGSKSVHPFDMAVNGREMFRFTSQPDSLHRTWTVKGPGGATLPFLFLPAGSFEPGTELTLRVTGEAAGSQAWFMVFEHRLGDAAWIRPLPALVRTSGPDMQPVSVDIEHYGKTGKAVISMAGAEPLTGELRWGLSSFKVMTAPVNSPAVRRVSVRSGGEVIADTSVSLLPVRRRTLYLLPHSHTDIGYSAYQAVVEKNHMRYIDEAMDIAERTAGYPEGARFRWNIEVMWPLESYIAAATPAQKDRLARAVAQGWIGLNALNANILTGLCRPEELFHMTDFARKASSRFGVPVKAAMISDIPAYSSSIVPALAKAGVRYFSSGPNYVPSLPDGGDRIGFALKSQGDSPFYWVSGSGEDSVLFWMAGRAYSWFHGLNMGELGGAQTTEIFDYVSELDARNYPYDMIQVRYTVGGDNGPPDPRLPDVVRAWNDEYASPRFAIATTEELFEKFEKKYGTALPRRTGDLTPYWEDGAASTARELGENRETAEEISQSETLYALMNPAAYEAGTAYRAWRGVHLFDEHTWGASNSITDPDSPDVRAQWEYKLSFLRSAEEGERTLRAGIVKPFPAGPALALDIVNTASWPRSGVVMLPKTLSVGGLRARDGAGNPVPAQRISTGETAILVHNVPAFGSLSVRFETGEPFIPAAPATASGTTLRSGSLAATVDPATGAITHISAGGGNLVDTAGGAGVNQYWYVPGRDPRRAVHDVNVSVSIVDAGPLVAALSVASAPPGGTSLTRRVQIDAGEGRIDITDTLVKSRVREKERVHFGFPFSVPGGSIKVGNAFGYVRPDSDQLPGSCRDFFCAERWVDVSNALTGVTVALSGAPLIETGTMTDETQNRSGVRSWKEKAGTGTIFYSYALNNYWHTNYKADQEGEIVFRYAITPHGPFDPAEAEKGGIDASQPLLPVPHREKAAQGHALLTIEPSSVIATALKPAADGKGWILHLYNAGRGTSGLRLEWHGTDRREFYRSDLTERRGEAAGFPVVMPPSGITILRIE